MTTFRSFLYANSSLPIICCRSLVAFSPLHFFLAVFLTPFGYRHSSIAISLMSFLHTHLFGAVSLWHCFRHHCFGPASSSPFFLFLCRAFLVRVAFFHLFVNVASYHCCIPEIFASPFSGTTFVTISHSPSFLTFIHPHFIFLLLLVVVMSLYSFSRRCFVAAKSFLWVFLGVSFSLFTCNNSLFVTYLPLFLVLHRFVTISSEALSIFLRRYFYSLPILRLHFCIIDSFSRFLCSSVLVANIFAAILSIVPILNFLSPPICYRFSVSIFLLRILSHLFSRPCFSSHHSFLFTSLLSFICCRLLIAMLFQTIICHHFLLSIHLS